MPAKSKKQPTSYITPYLLYKDVGRALDWLKKSFGFMEYGERFTGPDGAVQHAAMQHSDGSIFMMGCPGKQYRNPKKLRSISRIELFYVAADGKLMKVSVKPGEGLEDGGAIALFETPLNGKTYQNAIYHQYDVSADGSRFLLRIPRKGSTPAPITVIMNWTAGRR